MNSKMKQPDMISTFVRATGVFVVCALLCVTSAVAEQQRAESSLRIYLPREITVEDARFTLGQVGIVRGSDLLVEKANKVSLGRISAPGRKIVLDRSTMLSRLACSGIPASKVTLSGAEKVTVRRHSKIVSGTEFVELAGAFLRKNPAAASVCQINPMRLPAELIIPDANAEIELSPTLIGGIRNQARIRIAILADGKKIARRDVNFNLKYTCSKVVALVDIAKGQTITAENVRIEKTVSDYPQAADWTAPYGFIARRQIAANSTIRPAMVALPVPNVLIKRNESVVIRIARPGLVVTALAKALQKGQPGDSIKVRNLDSNRIILVTVNDDGTVKPVF